MNARPERGAGLTLLEHDTYAVRIDVFQVARPHQQPALVAAMADRVRRDLGDGLINSGAVLRGHGGKDVATVAVTTTPALSAGRRPDLYTVEIVDRLSGEKQSIIEQGSPLFHFVNVFQIAPGRRDAMVDYFAHTIPYVRKQPGYVATNLLVSLDGRQAVNIGQYHLREHFLAIFRQPDVLASFARGYPKRIMAPIAGVIPRPPRLRLYDLALVADGQPSSRP
jgi:hypothetical protein